MIGRFYFKQAANGNLLGEFSNNSSRFIQTEAAEANAGSSNYIGTYRSTWNDEGEPVASTLTIRFKENTNDQIYTLIWQVDDVVGFWGEGMLCDNILIGDYRDFEHIRD